MKKALKRVILAVAAVALLGAVVIFKVPEKTAAADAAHTHKVCVGTAHEGCAHEDIEFEPFPEFNDGTKQPIFRAKSYYLTKDIVLEDEGRIFIEKGVTNLCLNGHSITKNGGQIIDVNQIGDLSAELNICDCTGNGMIKNTSADDAWNCISVLDDSVLNLYSGTIDGGANGSGITVHRTTGTKGSTANIYGGKVRCENGIAIYTQDPDTSLNIYGGEISSSDYYTLYVEDERNTVSVYGGKITGSAANPYSTVMIMGDGACLDIKGGEVVGENYSAVYCHTNSTLRISDGVVRSESTANTCIHNIGTLIVSGGTVSGGGDYGIRNYRSSAKATINGGTISCKGTSIYNYDNGVFEISGGEITSESGNGISNRSALTVSGGTVSGNIALRNYDNGATATISGGQLSCKGNFGIWNYNGGALNITDGKVSGGEYCLYNQEGTITISGGIVSAKSNYALYNEEKGTAVINGGTLNSTFSPITNYGTLNISGGIFGAENPATTTYIINQKFMNLSGSPVFRNTPIWLKTDDNIGITGELAYSPPCLVYINSTTPRVFTSDWSKHMGDKAPSNYFKSPYSLCTVSKSDGEALLRDFMITFDANGGVCETSETTVDESGKASTLPEATREDYIFDGWFTAKEGGEEITEDTVFTDDAVLYAHWSENGKVSKEVKPGENAPKTILTTPIDELIEAVLTTEEQENVDNGINIKIILTVDDATDKASAEDKETITNKLNGLINYKLGQYLDVNLIKFIGDSDGVNITQTNKPITITFEIPVNFRGKSVYSVIRVHNGEATVLSDQDNNPNTVTIETDRFSTYALAYQEKTVSPGPNGGNSHPSHPSTDDTSDDTSSDTSDDTSSSTSSETDDTSSGTSSDTSSDISDNTSSGNSSDISNGDENSNIPSESSSPEDKNNPATGMAVSLTPLIAALSVLIGFARKKNNRD